MEEIKFDGTDLFLRAFKSNKDSFRIEIDCGRDQYEKIKDIPLLPQVIYEIVIKPKEN